MLLTPDLNMVQISVCIIGEEVPEKGILTIWLKLFMKLMRLMHWISQVMLEFLMVLIRNFF